MDTSNNNSLKSFLNITSDIDIQLKESLDIFLFSTLENFYHYETTNSITLGKLKHSDIDRYTKHNFRAIINALVFDDKKFLIEAFEFVYRVYIHRGADIDLMLLLYKSATKSAKKLFSSTQYRDIHTIIEYLSHAHYELIKKAKIPKVAIKEKNMFYKEQKELYQLILDTKIDEAEKLSYDFILEHGLEVFIEKVIRIVMMQVGYDWEIDKISYAKEHLITAVFENMIEKFISDSSPDFSSKDLIMVVTPPSEHHSSAADTFTKFLKSQGHNAYLLKGQKEIDAIISQISLSLPKIVAVSVTLPTNLYEVYELIYEVKRKLIGLHVKFMVGGQALAYYHESVMVLGADAYIHSPQEASKKIYEWLKKDTNG